MDDYRNFTPTDFDNSLFIGNTIQGYSRDESSSLFILYIIICCRKPTVCYQLTKIAKNQIKLGFRGQTFAHKTGKSFRRMRIAISRHNMLLLSTHVVLSEFNVSGNLVQCEVK